MYQSLSGAKDSESMVFNKPKEGPLLDKYRAALETLKKSVEVKEKKVEFVLT